MTNIKPLTFNTNTTTNAFDGSSALNINNIIPFTGHKNKSKKDNDNTSKNDNGEQEVFPFSDRDVENIAAFLKQRITNNVYGAQRDYTIFVLGISTGLRCGDIISLTWEKVVNEVSGDINESILVLEEKTKNTRSKRERRNIEFNDTVVEVLRDYYLYESYRLNSTPSGYLFKSKQQIRKDKVNEKTGEITKKKGECRVGVDHVRKLLKEAAFSLGITYNVGSHSMRKTFGKKFMDTYGLEDPLAIHILQKILGHSSPEMTMKYIGMEKEIERSIYNNIKFNI